MPSCGEPCVIRDREALEEEFIPRLVVHRDGQMKALRDCLKPALEGKKATDAIMYGRPGTGKTCMARYVASEFREESSVPVVYVNCWYTRSRFKILYEVLRQLGHALDIHRKGMATDELLETLSRHKKAFVAVLDEADQAESAVLYDLLRLGNASIVLITNTPEALHAADQRVVSSLAAAERIAFPQYSTMELTDILRSRAEWGLAPLAISGAQMRRIAEAADGDARAAIGMMRLAAEKAENQCMERIDDAQIAEMFSHRIKKMDMRTDDVDEHGAVLLEIIKERGEITPGELYVAYQQRCEGKCMKPVVERSVRKALERLTKQKMICAKGEGRWRVYRGQ